MRRGLLTAKTENAFSCLTFKLAVADELW